MQIGNLPSMMKILIGLLFMGSLALASEKSPIGSHWPVLLESLENRGIQKIGDFDLLKFKDQAQDIQWLPLDGAPTDVQAGSRSSAYYIWNQKKVFVSDELPAEALSSLPHLELHEAFGATGYNDNEYALSTALSTLSKAQGAQLQKLLSVYGKTLFSKKMMAAGGTGVSGGGDLATLYIKDQVLRYFLSRSVSSEFLAFYPHVNFEPLKDRTIQTVHIQYRFTVQPDSKGRRETYTVMVPMSRWRQGAKARAQLVKEIAQRLSEVFANYGFQTVPNIPNMTDFSRTIPAFEKVGQAPKQAGNFYFTCQLRYGQGGEEITVVLPSGVNMVSTKAGSLNNGEDDVMGYAWLLGDGKILQMGLDVQSARNKKIRLPTTTRAQNPNRAKIQMTWRGYPLSYECMRAK